MKKILKIAAVLIVLVIGYVLYVCSTTGFFRKIHNSYTGQIIKIDIPGAEDFAISREDGFLIISSDDRAARREGISYTSGLYYMDLNDDSYRPFLLKAVNEVPIFPHGISILRIDTNTYRLLVVNHVTSGSEAVSSLDPDTKHYIEEYTLKDSILTHIKTYAHHLINSPNDVVIVDRTKFYFTNDHGSKTKLGLAAEDYLGFKRSNVVFFDGNNFTISDSDIAYANGINVDHDRNLLYVASPRDFLVKVYIIKEDGTLNFQTDIDCNSGVDNLELDSEGKVWIGSHPDLLTFASYAGGRSPYAPSEVIVIDYTNKSKYTVASVFESDGQDMSASTTAIPHEGKVFVGNVMDNHFIILDQAALKRN